MSNAEGYIKGIMRTMFTRGLRKVDLWKSHEIEVDGHTVYIELRQPEGRDAYGSITVFHPIHGKWVALAKYTYKDGSGEVHEKPKQIFSSEYIRDYLRRHSSRLPILNRVYGIS